MVCHQILSNSCGLCENFEAHIKESDWSVSLDPFGLINLKQLNYLTKIEPKQVLLFDVEIAKQI
jgi:hypothetical protein